MRYHASDITDEELFDYVRRGDEKAFDTLFLKYYGLLCAYARQFVSLRDGQEVVQEMMVWLWENSRKMVIESSLKSYLFKAVKNRCLTLIYKNERSQRAAGMLWQRLQGSCDEPDCYVVEELSQKIEAALERLPASYREAFEQNRFGDRTYQEIADQAGVSAKTIDYRIQQALKQLRRELKDYLPLLLLLLH